MRTWRSSMRSTPPAAPAKPKSEGGGASTWRERAHGASSSERRRVRPLEGVVSLPRPSPEQRPPRQRYAERDGGSEAEYGASCGDALGERYTGSDHGNRKPE